MKVISSEFWNVCGKSKHERFSLVTLSAVYLYQGSDLGACSFKRDSLANKNLEQLCPLTTNVVIISCLEVDDRGWALCLRKHCLLLEGEALNFRLRASRVFNVNNVVQKGRVLTNAPKQFEMDMHETWSSGWLILPAARLQWVAFRRSFTRCSVPFEDKLCGPIVPFRQEQLWHDLFWITGNYVG